MRRILLMLALSATAPVAATAQVANENISVWTAIMGTPLGALSPMDLDPHAAAGEQALAVRYSAWSLPDRARNDNLGLSLVRHSKTMDVGSITVGYFNPGCEGCPGIVMVGGALVSPAKSKLLGERVLIDLNTAGSVGYGRSSNYGYGSVSLGVPLVVSVLRPRGRLSVFLEPDFGAGMYDGDIGWAPVLGGGVSWRGVRGSGLQLSANRVIVDRSRTNLGLTLIWPRRAR